MSDSSTGLGPSVAGVADRVTISSLSEDWTHPVSGSAITAVSQRATATIPSHTVTEVVRGTLEILSCRGRGEGVISKLDESEQKVFRGGGDDSSSCSEEREETVSTCRSSLI